VTAAFLGGLTAHTEGVIEQGPEFESEIVAMVDLMVGGVYTIVPPAW